MILNHQYKVFLFLKKNKKIIAFTILCYLLLFIAIVVLLFPIYSLVITSLKGPGEMAQLPPKFFVNNPTVNNFQRILTNPKFAKYIFNSLFVSLTTTLCSIVIAIPAGYSLARFRYAGRELLSTSVLLAYMFPPILLTIPLFLSFSSLNLIDTYGALILSYTTFSLPFCVWMLRGFFLNIPSSLEEAARIDGCSYLKAIIKIIMPLSAPGIATAAIFSFLLAWNNYLFPLVLINSDSKRPVTVGLQTLMGRYGMDYSLIMAACGVLIGPPILVFFLFQKYIVKGLTAGAVKG